MKTVKIIGFVSKATALTMLTVLLTACQFTVGKVGSSAPITDNPGISTLTLTDQPEITQDPDPDLALPFQDSFDQGLNPLWRIVVGKPMILDGRLTPVSDQLRIEIGNTRLNQYTLEMDMWGKEKDYCGFGYSNHLTINFSPNLRFSYGYTDSNGRLVWDTFENNEWKEIARFDGLECGRLKVNVSNDSYSVLINGQLVNELKLDPAVGPLSIGIDEGVTIDNLEIK